MTKSKATLLNGKYKDDLKIKRFLKRIDKKDEKLIGNSLSVKKSFMSLIS